MTLLEITIPDKPAWAGPYEGGITQSLMTKFRACPFRFYLYAYCGLKEAQPLDNRLVWGDTLHKGLEHLIRGDSYELANSRMKMYLDARYPRAPRTYRATTALMLKLYQETVMHNLTAWAPLETEVHLEDRISFKFKSVSSSTSIKQEVVHTYENVLLRGKCDITNSQRTLLGDHKGKGTAWSSPETVRSELGQDVQMNLYAHLLGGVKDWLYDLILIPEYGYRVPTPRAGETPEEFADRIFYHHKDTVNNFPIANSWGHWINQVPYHQPDDERNKFMRKTIHPIIAQMVDWWELVTYEGFNPNDEDWYNTIFYRSPIRMFDPAKTPNFKCEYHSLLINKDDFSSLIPVKSFYPELENKED